VPSTSFVFHSKNGWFFFLLKSCLVIIMQLLKIKSKLYRINQNVCKGILTDYVQRQLSNFSLYHGEKKLIFNDMMVVRSALYKTKTLNWIFIVLAH
jgi:hypothetical protein